MRATGGDGDQLDGAESELQVDFEHGDEKDCRHGQCEEGNQTTYEYGEAAEDLDENGEPRQQVRGRNREAMQGCSEEIWAAVQLGEPVLDEAETDDEAQR